MEKNSFKGKGQTRNPEPEPDPMDVWFIKYPALKAAYAEAVQRYENLPGVCGIGVGRKFLETSQKYGRKPQSTGGMCVKIYVERKIKGVSLKNRICSRLDVPVPGDTKKTRVLLDVVQVGHKDRQGPVVAEMHSGRDMPTAGSILPGRLFSFGNSSVSGLTGEHHDNNFCLGTTGALVRYEDGSVFAFSAGHVFTNPCRSIPKRPEGRRAIGAFGRRWVKVEGADFYPPNLRHGDGIKDLMIYPVPQEYLTTDNAAIWPEGFLGQLASFSDIDRALKSEPPNGFIWVERKGNRPEKIDIDLEANLPKMKINAKCPQGGTKEVKYINVWPVRFTSQDTTIGGDSGSPLFLRTGNNSECKLLGFHFMEVETEGKAFSMDAQSFFRDTLLSTPGQDIWFV